MSFSIQTLQALKTSNSFSYICDKTDPNYSKVIVSDEFLKQCDTEAFLKFNSCFSTEFER